MKKILLVIRWIVGILFIFSGLVKANDPLGLSYKMQEFFEAWNLHGLNDLTLPVAFSMNIFEVLAGVAVIIGWRMKLFSWLLLLLIIFFSFLTGYAQFSGKITTCGCFGDCLPLTPMQSFTKDILLLLLILVLFVYRKKISPGINPAIAFSILILAVLFTIFLQRYVLTYLPLADCLPYKTGNDLQVQRQIPKGAITDSIEMTFQYKKNGKTIEFTQENLPGDLDSTYEFLNRYDKVIRKGNAIAPISDFALQTAFGNDSTDAVLNQPNYYVLLMAKDFSTQSSWRNEEFAQLQKMLKEKNIPLFIVTADKENADKQSGLENISTFMFCDATVIKTAARVNPTYFLMRQSNILLKCSYTDASKLITEVNKIALQ